MSGHAVALLLARVLLSPLFLYSGVDKIWRWSVAQREVTASGLPWPTFLHVVTVIIHLGGGISLLLGLEAQAGALLLALFLIPATVIYHPFWKYSGEVFVGKAGHFLSNVAIMGGLGLIFVFGSGPISLIDRPLVHLPKCMLVGQSTAGAYPSRTKNLLLRKVNSDK
jgi:putative oxidoreductase